MAQSKRKRSTTLSKVEARQQAYRRHRVARLLAQGYQAAEIAVKLGVSMPTVKKDSRIIEEQWWAHTQLDQSAIIAREVRLLETARADCLRAYYDERNRHGEGHLTGYLSRYAKFSEMLHDLLRLRDDPRGQQAAQQQATPVTLVVKSREEADRFAPGGVPNLDAIRAVFAGRNES